MSRQDKTAVQAWLSAEEEAELAHLFGEGGVRAAVLAGIDAAREELRLRAVFGDVPRTHIDLPAKDVRLNRIAVRTVIDNGKAFIRTLEQQLRNRTEANDNTFTMTLRGYLDIERQKVAEFQSLLDRLPSLEA